MTSEPPSQRRRGFLLADHQAGVPEGVIKAPSRVEAQANALALARAGPVLAALLVITTSEAPRAHLANLTRAADPSNPEEGEFQGTAEPASSGVGEP
jgi:hypothetical protein